VKISALPDREPIEFRPILRNMVKFTQVVYKPNSNVL
jgi:hypothetical protein